MILDNPWILEIFTLAISIIFSIFIINILFYILNKVDSDKKFFNFFKLKNPLIFISFLAFFTIITNIFDIEIIKTNSISSVIKILTIFNFAWLSISLVNVLRDYLYQMLNLSKKDNIKERTIITQIQYIKSVLTFLIILISFSLLLLSFDSFKNIGMGLITSVGVLGIVVGFAAQKSFSNLLAGFQIAFTQPIRIDDVVVVENEWGRVEEITLTYVVVCIWDQRRLILPISYFIDNPFQNWTRSSADILGTVFFYVDYKIPILEIKQEFRKILESSELWDKKVGILQVTSTTEKTMELRGIVSAKDSPQLWDLRCYVREKMIEYIQKQYPDNLPKTRLEFSNKLN